MSPKSTFVLHKNLTRDSVIARLTAFLARLPGNQTWRVDVARYQRSRSDQQNRYLWGIVYRQILETGALEGWEAEDLHEYFLGEHFGWETLTGFGKKKLKPLRRSSKLTTTEFMDFVGFIQRRMALEGLYIEDPNEFREAAA